jgi:hypothetical protein
VIDERSVRGLESGGVAVQFHNHDGGSQPEFRALGFSRYTDLRLVPPRSQRALHCLLLCGACGAPPP